MDEQEQDPRWLDEERDGESDGEGQDAPLSRGTAERSPAGASAAVPRESGASGNRYSVGEKLDYLRRFVQSGGTLVEFCRRERLNTKSFCDWRRQFDALGEAGLRPKPNLRNTGGHSGRVIPADERRALVESFLRMKLSQAVFARTYGISVSSLSKWLRRYHAHGPKGLEPGKRGRKPGGGGGGARIALPIQAEILNTKRRFPDFGMRKVRDYMRRFFGLKVSAGGVRATLEREGIAPLPMLKKRRRGPDRIRRFERATPMDLWQSDITSYVLTRNSRRVYLTVFLDDRSRYVVAWSLATRQTGAFVCDTLLDGMASFGKPKEVLTDQGRQYFAWRGKSEFQKLLDKEGIRHVVARSHHPQTVGKCERLWKTVGAEFWERAQPQDLDDARERLGHFFSHYNHFRPHQSLEGMTPADRFFGAETELRAMLEAQQAEHELALAIDQPPRKPVFLIGQVGDQKVSMRALDGRIEFGTEGGAIEAMALKDAGIPQTKPEAKPANPTTTHPEDEHATQHDVEHSAEPDEPESAHEQSAADRAPDVAVAADHDAHPARAEAPDPQAAAAGDLGEGPVGGGEPGGARAGHGDRAPDHRDVARQDHAPGSGRALEGAAGADEPAGPPSDVRADGGLADPAAHAQEEGGSCERCGRAFGAGDAAEPGERPGALEEAGATTEAGALGERAGERSVAPLPGAAERGTDRCEDEPTPAEADQDAPGPGWSTASASPPNCERERSRADNEQRSRRATA